MNRLRTLATILLAISVAVSCSDDGGGAIFTGDEPSANDVLDDMPEINDEPADQPSEPDDQPNDTTDEPSEPDDEPDDTTDEPSEPDDEPDDQLSDQPIGAGPYPIADIAFDVNQGNGATSTYRLACLGDTATFTGDTALVADHACLALAELEVRDRLLTDDHLGRRCTQQYGGPEVARITGTLDDEPIDATIDRTNGCGIADWGILLAALLPPPA
jgi:hypothetical protein